MRNKVDACICSTKEPQIKFEENKRKIVFGNPKHHAYKKVQVDGCTITGASVRCDKLLLSDDEHEERYVELKGVDVMHAIDQLEASIISLGEFDENRYSYVICTNVAPAFTTQIQKKQALFYKKYKSRLVVREKQLTVPLN